MPPDDNRFLIDVPLSAKLDTKENTKELSRGSTAVNGGSMVTG